MKIRTSEIKKIIREVLEEEHHQDFNVQSAVDRAKERGCSDAEIDSVMASSHNPNEIIMFLDNLGEDQYPTPSHDLEENK